MRFTAHHGARRVEAREVRLVLDIARPLTAARWAEFFGVHAQTIKAWRADGMVLGLWSAPTSQSWEVVKAEAVQELNKQLSYLKVQTTAATGGN